MSDYGKLHKPKNGAGPMFLRTDRGDCDVEDHGKFELSTDLASGLPILISKETNRA